MDAVNLIDGTCLPGEKCWKQLMQIWKQSSNIAETLLKNIQRITRWLNKTNRFWNAPCSKGSPRNKFSAKVGNLAQGGRGGSDPIPTFINHCFYGIFHPFLPKKFDKFTEKIPTFGEGVGQVGWAKFPTFTKKLFWGRSQKGSPRSK